MFHRIDDLEAMDAPRFFAFARRLSTYDGAVRAAALAQDRPDEPVEYRPVTGAPVGVGEDAAAALHRDAVWGDAPGLPPAFAYGMPSAADLGL